MVSKQNKKSMHIYIHILSINRLISSLINYFCWMAEERDDINGLQYVVSNSMLSDTWKMISTCVQRAIEVSGWIVAVVALIRLAYKTKGTYRATWCFFAPEPPVSGGTWEGRIGVFYGEGTIIEAVVCVVLEEICVAIFVLEGSVQTVR